MQSTRRRTWLPGLLVWNTDIPLLCFRTLARALLQSLFVFTSRSRGRVLDAGVSSIGYDTCGLQSRRAKWDANECLRRRRVKHFSGIEKLDRISLVLGRCVFCLSAVSTTVLTSLEERTNRHRIQGRRRMVTRAMTVTF